MGKFTKQPGLGRGAATGVFSMVCVEKEGLNMAPQVGLEPTTLRLTAECSTIELLRSIALVPLNQTLAHSVKSHRLPRLPKHPHPSPISLRPPPPCVIQDLRRNRRRLHRQR